MDTNSLNHGNNTYTSQGIIELLSKPLVWCYHKANNNSKITVDIHTYSVQNWYINALLYIAQEKFVRNNFIVV